MLQSAVRFCCSVGFSVGFLSCANAGPAVSAFYPPRVRFDERGRRIGATPLIVQWQDGEPYTVIPTAVATRPIVWHK